MKKSVNLKIGDKTFTLCFTIKALSELERLEGRSLILLINALVSNPGGFMNLMTVDFLVHALNAGLVDKPKDFDAYDFIDAYCAQEDVTLDDLMEGVLKGILASGLFTMGSPEKNAEQINRILGLK